MICPKCGFEGGDLTRDHIIPRWLLNPTRLKELGIRKQKGHWGKEMRVYTERICFQCNVKKGGRIDYTHPVVRKFMQKMVDIIQENLENNSLTP